jgi:adenine-specific DNA glycosylase
MFQFPLIEFNDASEKMDFIQSRNFEFVSTEVKHVLSHQHLYCHFVVFKGLEDKRKNDQFWVNNVDISNYPVPRVIERFIEENSTRIFNY